MFRSENSARTSGLAVGLLVCRKSFQIVDLKQFQPNKIAVSIRLDALTELHEENERGYNTSHTLSNAYQRSYIHPFTTHSQFGRKVRKI